MHLNPVSPCLYSSFCSICKCICSFFNLGFIHLPGFEKIDRIPDRAARCQRRLTDIFGTGLLASMVDLENNFGIKFVDSLYQISQSFNHIIRVNAHGGIIGPTQGMDIHKSWDNQTDTPLSQLMVAFDKIFCNSTVRICHTFICSRMNKPVFNFDITDHLWCKEYIHNTSLNLVLKFNPFGFVFTSVGVFKPDIGDCSIVWY